MTPITDIANRQTDHRTERKSARIHVPGAVLEGETSIPAEATGLAVFVHGSGSGRTSPRNAQMARFLREAHVGTLLFDLLTRKETEFDRETRLLRFDIPLLSRRLVAVLDWISEQPHLRDLDVGLMGSSTGAAAALRAAARRREQILAVVSRGGRPDLAGDALPLVTAPTLLVVGTGDPAVAGLNRLAMRHMRCNVHLALVPRAGHLFEEPGTLAQAARLAAGWFASHLSQVVH